MSENIKSTEMRATDQNEAKEQLIVGSSDHPEQTTEGAESQDEEVKKVNSFQTILSIWNSMIGSSTVVLPNNVYNSGIIPAIFLSIIYGYICFYTCKIYCDFGEKDPDFSITVEKYFMIIFGPKIAKIAKNTQIFFCTFIVTGALFIYFLIMTQNIYPVICLILKKIGNIDIDSKDLTPELGRFSLIYLGIVLCFFLFPFIIKKDVGFLVKLSSLGIYFISALIIFEVYTGISSIINTDFDFQYIKNNEDSDKRHLKLFGEDPAMFAGTLSMGYFCHTTILPIIKANKKQENNIRDLILGYIFVGLTFSLSGIFGYIGFSGKKFDIEFEDNWFMFFNDDNYLILFFRLLNVFQLFSVFPILAYVVRIQIFNFFYGNDYPSKKHSIIYGIVLLCLCLIVLYFCYNILSKFLAIIGATSSMILLYSFPPIVNTINYFFKLEVNINDNKNKKEKEIKEEKVEKELKEEKKEEKEEKEEKEKKEEENVKNEKIEEDKEIKDKEKKNNDKIIINEVISICDTDENIEKEETDIEENKKEMSENNKIEIHTLKKLNKIGFKDILFILGQSSIIVIGIATVVFQFTKINFFNVHLKD